MRRRRTVNSVRILNEAKELCKLGEVPPILRNCPILIETTQEEPQQASAKKSYEQMIERKKIVFRETGLNLGKGKFGKVDLIIYEGKLSAIKRIRKD